MASSTKQLENLDNELDALSTPTSAQVYAVSRDYDGDLVAASAARRAINGGGGGSQPSETVTRHVTSAEILSLNTTPIEVVAAPGSGKVILPRNGFLVFNYGTTPYAVAGNNTNFQLTTPLGAADGFASLLEIAGAQYCLEGTSDAISAWAPNGISDIASGFGGDWTIAKWENAALVFFFSDSEDPTNGDGTIDLYVEYTVWDLP